MERRASNINIKNRRASFDYLVVDTYTAGIVLTGTEIKSIRESKASLVDTYCLFIGGELWVKNMHIAEYFYGSYNNHSARRDRKLLLERKELRKLQQAAKNPGFTIVPMRLFINEKGGTLDFSKVTNSDNMFYGFGDYWGNGSVIIVKDDAAKQ